MLQQAKQEKPFPISNPDIGPQVSFGAESRAGAEINLARKLKMESCGTWDMAQEEWDTETREDPYYSKIISTKDRPSWEMEQIIPGADWDDITDPILDGIDFWHAGKRRKAISNMKCLIDLDERCLDAYAHLGIFNFDTGNLKNAMNWFKMGTAIGLKSISKKVNDVFLWGFINNRPFLRCMQGLALTYYRQGRTADALPIFIKMLWFNPRDNQCARFLIEEILRGKPWESKKSL